MISRVAESCFWLNRYVERVETLARMLDVNQAFQLDVTLAEAERWRPLVIVTGQEAEFLDETPAASIDDGEVVQRYLTWSRRNPASILSSLAGARENARTIRETISLEMWETLNDLWVWMNDRGARRRYDSDRHEFYLRLRNQCLLFHGVAHATMLHEDPFEFMRLGTALERAGQTARILDMKYHSVGPTDLELELPAESAQWLATLRSCSGVEPFFKRSENTLSGKAVARFLLFDPAFPRSVLHNLLRARNFLGLVRPGRHATVGATSWRRVGELVDRFQKMEVEDVLAQGLHNVVTWAVGAMAEVCDAIHDDFFDPTPEARPVAMRSE